ncbi:MAG: serine hydrolase domain-containing protein, partial [Actinomycetota bacterium]
MTLEPAIEAIDALAIQAMDRWGPVGMVIALTDRERTLAIRPYGFANLEAQVPVVEESLFQIGSIGKSFTAFALMPEVEAMRLNLQQPITDFVPWFDPPPKMLPITIHDLLTHTAGLSTGTESHQEPMTEAW